MSSTTTRPGITEAEQAAKDRDGDTCQRCGRNLQGQPASKHHRKLKGRGTPPEEFDRVENIVVLCGTGTTGCHGWAHAERTASHEAGWTCWTWEDPAVRPCLTLVGTMVMFLEDGTKVVDEIPEIPPTPVLWTATPPPL
jgi:hypothetical protein